MWPLVGAGALHALGQLDSDGPDLCLLAVHNSVRKGCKSFLFMVYIGVYN